MRKNLFRQHNFCIPPKKEGAQPPSFNLNGFKNLGTSSTQIGMSLPASSAYLCPNSHWGGPNFCFFGIKQFPIDPPYFTVLGSIL